MGKTGYIYILTNKFQGTLYIGVTSNLIKRIYEHKEEFVSGFTQKYHLHYLVYYETYDSITNAIAREKQLKKWNRNKKINLIQAANPEWDDLFNSIIG